jgi:hypothetical protein
MKAIQAAARGGYDALRLVDIPRPGYDGADRASALSNSRAPAAAKARRAIQLAIHWPVMTIDLADAH